MKIKKISFQEVAKLDDSHTVMPALDLKEKDYDETLKSMNKFFRDEVKMITGEIVSLKRITGNVLGNKGRHDYLMTYSEGNKINPILRLASQGQIIWVSDFVNIYGEDFKQ